MQSSFGKVLFLLIACLLRSQNKVGGDHVCCFYIYCRNENQIIVLYNPPLDELMILDSHYV